MDFQEIKWTDEFEVENAPHMNGYSSAIKSECLAGEAKIWKSKNGVFILGAENTELVVMFAKGKNMKSDFEAILEYAKQEFKSIRVHSARKGMEKFVKTFGLKTRESIFGLEF